MSDANTDRRTVVKYETTLTPSGVERRVPTEILRSEVQREGEIEEWLLKHFEELKLDAALIGNQIIITDNKSIDMFAITRKGQLCIIELKRDKAERGVFIQILDYARLLSGFLIGQINAMCSQQKPHATSLSDVYTRHFNAELPRKRNRNPLLVILAEEFNPSEIQMALYLNQEHDFCIRLISYEAKRVAGSLMMEFRHELLPTDRLRVTSKMPDQVFEMRFQETSEWTWEKCTTASAIPVSNDIAARIQDYKADAPLSLLVYLDRYGYVASGTVDDISESRVGSLVDRKYLLMVWDVVVQLGDAIFRDKTEQPTEELQELIDEDKWSIIVGLLRFNAERIRRRQDHGGKRRPFKRKERPHLPAHTVHTLKKAKIARKAKVDTRPF